MGEEGNQGEEEMDAPYILLVCTGNTCRSSMGEYLLRQLLRGRPGLQDLAVKSAGVWAVPGLEASPQAVKALRGWGVDLSPHRTTVLTPDLVEGALLVLTMSEAHRRAVLNMVPTAHHKVFTLKEFATGKSGEVEDPMGGDEEAYRRCAAELHDLLERSLDKIEEFTRRSGGGKKER